MVNPSTNTSLFIHDLLKGCCEAERAGRWLCWMGETALADRQQKKLALAGQMLSTLPGRFLKAGELCQALSLAPADRAEAVKAIKVDSDRLDARISLALGAHEMRQENPDGAVALYQQAAKQASGDCLIKFLAIQNAAAAMDFAGDRATAESLLDSIAGLAWAIKREYPAYYLNYLNSRAMVDTNKERAIELAKIPGGSIYIAQYPEWKATLEDLQSQKPRGLVSFSDPRTPGYQRIYAFTDHPTRTIEELNAYADGGEQAVKRLKAQVEVMP